MPEPSENQPTAQPTDEKQPRRRVHPLERQPQPPPSQDETDKQSRQVMLHIPVVRPYITYTLIVVNVVIFLLGLVFPSFNNELVNFGANNQRTVLVLGEYHRLITAMFLHADILHILFNMYALFLIGRTVEGLFGHVRFALIYFLGGLAGSIVSIILNGPAIFSVGASGAVFAIFGAEMVYLYQHRKLLGSRAQAQLRSLVILAGMNLFIGIVSVINADSEVRIDNWAHIGGFVGGLILTWYIGPLFLLKRHPTQQGAFITEDVNPLSQRYQFVVLYIAALLALLIAGSLLVRR